MVRELVCVVERCCVRARETDPAHPAGDDASKTRAKAIDLCNNPKHREPKLDMAKRVIAGPLFPESWVQLDEEVRELWDRVAAEHVEVVA